MKIIVHFILCCFCFVTHAFEKIEKKEAKANVQVIKMSERVLFIIFVTAYSISNRDNLTMSQEQRLFCDSLISLVQSKQKKQK